MTRYEKKALKSGFKRIAGIDEAGRGPLAGPVVAACVILKDFKFQERIDDSKALSPRSRQKAYLEIIKKSYYSIGIADELLIDQINIFRAANFAMEQAVKNMPLEPDYLLIDGRMKLDLPHKRECIIKGDSKSISIACASIIAKVTRDLIMAELDKYYPIYGFKKHKGYGTKDHIDTIFKNGPSPIHRFTFSPSRQVLGL